VVCLATTVDFLRDEDVFFVDWDLVISFKGFILLPLLREGDLDFLVGEGVTTPLLCFEAMRGFLSETILSGWRRFATGGLKIISVPYSEPIESRVYFE
jgi:hypothetical protein